MDDSHSMGDLVGVGLSGYAISHAYSLAEAEEKIASGGFNLLLIDVSLPDGSGFDFCHRLSQNPKYQMIPKILLTGKSDASEKVYGFNCGADDYITKPFNPLELKARIDRFFRQSPSVAGQIYANSLFHFNIEFQRCLALLGEKKIDLGLTPTEFRILLVLAKAEGRVISRQDLARAIWEVQGVVINFRGIDTHIAHLRKKMGKSAHLISAVYGQGYSFNCKN